MLSRPNETERRLSASRRSLSHCLPAYTKICSEQFSLKSSLAEFTSHLSRPARHAAVAQPNNKRLTTVEVEAAVDAQVEVAEQQQSKANANANYTRRKRKFTACPAHLCVCVSVSTCLCVCVFSCLSCLAPLTPFRDFSFTFYVSFRVSFSRVSYNCFCAKLAANKIENQNQFEIFVKSRHILFALPPHPLTLPLKT